MSRERPVILFASGFIAQGMPDFPLKVAALA
jgi:hypothetical protein